MNAPNRNLVTPANLAAGQMPTVYDPNFQRYSAATGGALSTAQLAWFYAQPQFLVGYIGTRRWQKEICSAGATLVAINPAQVNYISIQTDAANPAISGMQVTTDLATQQKIAAVKQAVDNGAITGAIAVNGVRQLAPADITALYGFVVRYVQATYAVAATLLTGVSASPQTVTNPAQVDDAFGAIQVV